MHFKLQCQQQKQPLQCRKIFDDHFLIIFLLYVDKLIHTHGAYTSPANVSVLKRTRFECTNDDQFMFNEKSLREHWMKRKKKYFFGVAVYRIFVCGFSFVFCQ